MKKTLLKTMVSLVLAIALVVSMAAPAFAATKSLTSKQVQALKPTGVTASSYNYTKIKVSWTALSGVDGYQVYRATSKSGSYTKVATVKAGTTSYINTGRTTGKTYWYKVRGYKKVSGKTVYTKYSAADSAYARPTKVKNVAVNNTGTVINEGYVKRQAQKYAARVCFQG